MLQNILELTLTVALYVQRLRGPDRIQVIHWHSVLR